MEQNILKRSSKKLIIFEIVCVALIIGLIGYTYSFFNVTATNDSVIYGEAASVNLSLTVEKLAPSTNKGLVPQLDQYITSAVIGRNGSCVDDNNNNVCQVYKITVTNSGASVYVNGRLNLDAKNNPNLKWAIISGTTNPTLVSNANPYSYVKLTENELYNSNESKDYYIVLWISETGTIQTDQGGFSGVVTIGTPETVQVATAEETLSDLKLTLNTGTPSFSNTSCSSGCGEATVGIYKTEDDLGTSYYFRGDVENNYVLFADKYWRIIRINGDGSIRMIYDGTSAHDNGESSTDRQISTSTFNSSAGDNAYVGYMRGATGASTYEATHTNTTNSTIKTVLDNWYVTNIKDTTNEKYVVDAIYCNDREVSTANLSYTGDGSGTTKTEYKSRERLYTNKTPTLKCNQVNDRFTKGTTVSGVTGNGALTYPIGLITADEAAYAGGKNGADNSKYYLYTGNYYWTMSPYFFDGSNAYEFFVYSTGNLLSHSRVSVNSFTVRPVISLSSGALSSGSGTKTEPFKIG